MTTNKLIYTATESGFVEPHGIDGNSEACSAIEKQVKILHKLYSFENKGILVASSESENPAEHIEVEAYNPKDSTSRFRTLTSFEWRRDGGPLPEANYLHEVRVSDYDIFVKFQIPGSSLFTVGLTGIYDFEKRIPNNRLGRPFWCIRTGGNSGVAKLSLVSAGVSLAMSDNDHYRVTDLDDDFPNRIIELYHSGLGGLSVPMAHGLGLRFVGNNYFTEERK